MRLKCQINLTKIDKKN